jgi:hypothetical protein
MRFSLNWMFAAMVYVALAMTAIWQRSDICATVLLAGIAVAFLYSLILSFAVSERTQSKAIRWALLGSISFLGVCLAMWLTSFFANVGEFDLSFSITQLRVADGSATICDHIGNLSVIEAIDKSSPFSPSPQGNYGFSIPGMSFRYITLAGSDRPIWSWKMSLLVPAGVAAIAAIYFLKRSEVRSPFA